MTSFYTHSITVFIILLFSFNIKIFLQTSNKPEIFTLDNGDGEEEEPTFIGNWNGSDKSVVDASGEVVDWSTSVFLK